MLTQIDVECDNPFYMSVIGANPRDSLILQQVTGLGPPDISLFVGDYARDGGLYTGRRATTRNVVLTIGINPNYANGETVEGWRDILYKAFVDPTVDGDDVSLVLHDDIKPDRILTGYTEKFDGETFSQDLAVQISMICPDPFIKDAESTVLTPPSGTTWQTVPFTYAGTAEAGFQTTIVVSAATSTITLDNNGKTMVLTAPTIGTDTTFLNGDQITICTIRGNRFISLIRTKNLVTTTYDILYTLSDDSPWLELHSQSNSLQVYGAAKTNVVAGMNLLAYDTLYWGV